MRSQEKTLNLTIKHPSVCHSEPSGDDLYFFGLPLLINPLWLIFSESPVINRDVTSFKRFSGELHPRGDGGLNGHGFRREAMA